MPFTQAVKNPRSGSGGGFSAALDRKSDDRPGGFYASVNSPKKSSDALASVDGLLKLAKEKGVTGAGEIADEDKMSFLERLSAGLGALNPAEAIMRDYDQTESFISAYPKNVLQGMASALTGNDYGEQTKKRYFSDVVEAAGIENKYARFGLGLVGDIFLDPSTYFGGSLVRMSLKHVAAPLVDVGLKGIGRAAPGVGGGLRGTGTGAQGGP